MNKTQKYPFKMSFRLSEVEVEELKENAFLSGISLSKYIRNRSLGYSITSIADKKLIRELNLIGNYLVRVHKSGGDTLDITNSIRSLVKKIEGKL